MSTVKKYRFEMNYTPDFSYEGKCGWAMEQTDRSAKGFDAAIASNFDQTAGMIEDGEYLATPPHSVAANEVGFELLSASATPEEVSAQEEAIAAAKAEGKSPFHYEWICLRTCEVAQGDNPNRVRPTRGRKGTTGRARGGIAG